MAVWRVVCSGRLYTVESWANVFHINPAGAFDAEEVFDAFEHAYVNDAPDDGKHFLLPCPGGIGGGVIGVNLNSISLQAVNNPGIPQIRAMNHNGGQNLAGGLPLDTSLCISWRTALAGRSYRGRTYLPPFHMNANDDSGGTVPHPTSAYIDGLAIQAAKLIDDLVAANAVLCVYSRKLEAATTITGGYIDSSWDTQRRRGTDVPATRRIF